MFFNLDKAQTINLKREVNLFGHPVRLRSNKLSVRSRQPRRRPEKMIQPARFSKVL